tara:strand:+ start:158 stop:652 length:495 start_codon:yes stop_codon:yes gene_type:complete
LKKLTVIFLIIFVSCGNVRSFDYIIQSYGKREIIKSYPISKDKKYLNFILEGTFTDNLGNYGIWDNASTVTLQNNNVINLQGYGKRIYQNNKITYIKGFRNKQEQQAGVGKTEVVNASSSLMPLVRMSCTYAVNFYEDNAYLIHKCAITEKQKNILSNVSKKKE